MCDAHSSLFWMHVGEERLHGDSTADEVASNGLQVDTASRGLWHLTTCNGVEWFEQTKYNV